MARSARRTLVCIRLLDPCFKTGWTYTHTLFREQCSYLHVNILKCYFHATKLLHAAGALPLVFYQPATHHGLHNRLVLSRQQQLSRMPHAGGGMEEGEARVQLHIDTCIYGLDDVQLKCTCDMVSRPNYVMSTSTVSIECSCNYISKVLFTSPSWYLFTISIGHICICR